MAIHIVTRSFKEKLDLEAPQVPSVNNSFTVDYYFTSIKVNSQKCFQSVCRQKSVRRDGLLTVS